jgi:hypothetical protein
MRHSDVYRDLPPSDLDRVAFDGDEIVGRVLQHQHGPVRNFVWGLGMMGTKEISHGPPQTTCHP